jgi:hypothetical protein
MVWVFKVIKSHLSLVCFLGFGLESGQISPELQQLDEVVCDVAPCQIDAPAHEIKKWV